MEGSIGLTPSKIICWFIMIKREKWDVNRKRSNSLFIRLRLGARSQLEKGDRGMSIEVGREQLTVD